MYAKVFAQIFDSSIAVDPEVRHIFMDLLILADSDGVVDMTLDAIARRINVPLERVSKAITTLSESDPASRSEVEGGRRIKLIDSHRDWGWMIVNYAHYRDIRDEEGRRRYFRDYQRTRRASKHLLTPVKDKSHLLTPVNTCSAVLTHAEAEAEADCRERASVPEATEGSKERPAKPTLEEIKLYGVEGGLSVQECEKFFNHYESNGWKVGRNPMKKWKAALAGWKSRNGAGSKGQASRATLMRELEVVDRERDALRPDGMGSMTAAEADQFRHLTARRHELRVALQLEKPKA